MPKGYVLSGKDLQRVGEVVRDYESSPARRPISTEGYSRTSSRVVVFELISETPGANGLYDIYIMKRKPDGTGYEAVGTMQAKLEKLN